VKDQRKGIVGAGGHVDHFSEGRQVRIAFRREGSNDHAFDPDFAAQADAAAHFIHLGL
jgi:hypothetical protein